jgi:RND family efflux transporter MFP subunit
MIDKVNIVVSRSKTFTSSCLACLIMACSSGEKKPVQTQGKFQVITPVVMDTVYTKEFSAEIQSVQNVEVCSRVKGFIEKIYVDEGRPVVAGEVLFSLSSSEFKEELSKANAVLKSAEAELKSAEIEVKNTRLLVEKDIITKSELELANAKKDAILAKIDESKAYIAVARLNLSFTQVKAPFSGVINRIPKKVGSIVDEGTLLTTISNNKEMFAYFHVSENEYISFARAKELNKQKEVRLLLADNQLYDIPGTIETAENEIDKTTGNIAFRARFDNPRQLLKHGSSGKILLNYDLKQAMIIPQKTTFEIQDKTYVYALDSTNKVITKNVTLKYRLSNLYIVESGLSPQDRIIYEGIQQITEGEQIIPEPVSMSKLLLARNN